MFAISASITPERWLHINTVVYVWGVISTHEYGNLNYLQKFKIKTSNNGETQFYIQNPVENQQIIQQFPADKNYVAIFTMFHHFFCL